MKNKKGFIKIIVIIFIAIVVTYGIFNFDIIAFLEGEWFTGVLSSIWGIIKTVWYDYIARPIDFVLKR